MSPSPASKPRPLRRASISALLLAAIWTTLQPLVSHAEFVRGAGAALEDVERPANFAGSFGFDAERRRLDEGGEPRLRALRRLASLSHRTPAQVAELLDQWLSEEPKLSPFEVWTSLRALAPLGGQPAIAKHLAKILAGDAFELDSKSPYAPLVPAVAALALAKSGDADSTRLLGEWLRRPSERAELARQALLTHPPADVSPLLEASGPATPLLATTLGELNNAGAIPFLSKVVKRATADVQAAATIALAKLGVRETQDLATLWLKHGDSPEQLVAASAFVLLHFGQAGGKAAFGRLAAKSPSLALELANQLPPGSHRLALAEHLGALPDEASKRRVVSALSDVGPSAVSTLLTIFRERAELRFDTALALGELGNARAIDELRAAAGVSETRSAALVGLTTSAVLHPELDRTKVRALLANAAKSSLLEERDGAAAGLAAVDEGLARQFLVSNDQGELTAAALAANLHGAAYLRACLARLHQLAERPDSTVELSPRVFALSSALSYASPQVSLSHALLQALANSDAAIADTARWHAWTRSSALDEAFSGAQPAEDRAQLAASLGQALPLAEHPALAFTLLDVVLTDPDPERRAAAVQALRSRGHLPSVGQTLDWLANFDPSALVRHAAAFGLTRDVALRAQWISPPQPEPNAAAGYWIRIESPGQRPASLFVPHDHPSLVFIQAPPSASISSLETFPDPSQAPGAEPAIAIRMQVLRHR